jgi:DNA-binding transcriptional MerR regulator
MDMTAAAASDRGRLPAYLTLSYNSVRIRVMTVDGMWTIDELCGRVEAALTGGDAQQPSARVREIPDRRTIRWYSTIGLLDRPAAMQGRTALYHRRHLLQLLAVKRLQARGVPLAEVQARLAGATDRMLAGLAEVGEDWPAPAPMAGHSAALSTGSSPGRQPRFWAAQADAATAAASEARAAEFSLQPEADSARAAMLSASAARPAAMSRSRNRHPQPPGQVASHPDLLPAIRLGNGVTLTLGAAARPLNAGDVPAVKQAARPLLELLSQRGLDEPRS